MTGFKIEYLPNASKLVNKDGIYQCYAYEDGHIDVNKSGLISLGFKLQVTKEYFIFIFSNAFHALGGVGDSDYRGTYGVIIYNDTGKVIKYKKGDYVGNIGIIRTFTPEIEEN